MINQWNMTKILLIIELQNIIFIDNNHLRETLMHFIDNTIQIPFWLPDHFLIYGVYQK